ncbi:putative quinol monooxygenase [Neoroseomonas soli]|uniref:Antibiotic biosynthesis monooxygenase n=1 Tax=Neoroseomonas soli TaxID=1081025 RepID=A0A9X9WVY6_9PROT|nr:putative quinol monooxygenase [Neoroseomonas soli]MBR0671315.1 antibiotic biosynthesis monooxygenase [Neoroseomonas soli]
MPKIAIHVEFRPKPGCHAAFDALIREHAKLTVAEEPGCERFEVLQPLKADGTKDEGRVMLVEVYADRDAVKAHTQNPRMPKVREAYTPLIDERFLTMCEL